MIYDSGRDTVFGVFNVDPSFDVELQDFKVNFDNNLSTEVKIDGNRRILAYVVNSKDVAVRIEDMSGKYD